MDGPLFTYELPCIRKELPVAGRVDRHAFERSCQWQVL